MKSKVLTNALLIFCAVLLIFLSVMSIMFYARPSHPLSWSICRVTYHRNDTYVKVHYNNDYVITDSWQINSSDLYIGQTLEQERVEHVGYGYPAKCRPLEEHYFVTVPVNNGYKTRMAVFTGWYLDKTCTTAFDPNTPIAGDIDLYAGWEIIEPILVQ